ADRRGRTYDDRLVDLALLDAAARDRVLDRDHDHVAHPCGAALRAAQHLDAHHLAGARIVGDLEMRLLLYHDACSSILAAAHAVGCAGGEASISTTVKCLRLLIGRHSWIHTRSPTLYLLCSSCAANLLERLMNFL